MPSRKPFDAPDRESRDRHKREATKLASLSAAAELTVDDTDRLNDLVRRASMLNVLTLRTLEADFVNGRWDEIRAAALEKGGHQ